MPKSHRTNLINIANEFQNEFLAIERFAEYHEISEEQAETLIRLAQAARKDYWTGLKAAGSA